MHQRQMRVRAGDLRHVHGLAGWKAGAVLFPAAVPPEWSGGHHRGGRGTAGPRSCIIPGGGRRRPVRLLRARLYHDDSGYGEGSLHACFRGDGAGVSGRKSLPVHGLSQQAAGGGRIPESFGKRYYQQLVMRFCMAIFCWTSRRTIDNAV